MMDDCGSFVPVKSGPQNRQLIKINREINQRPEGNTVEEYIRRHPCFKDTQNYHEKTGDTLLHYAARLGLVNIAEVLIPQGGPLVVNFRNKDDKTPLHEAAQNCHYDVCHHLLEKGADVNAIKRGDWTPLMLACTKSHSEEKQKIVEFFLKKGAIIDFKNKDGWSALHMVAREGDPKVLRILIENGLNLEMKTKNGRTALHIAALHGEGDIVKILLKRGLKVNAEDNCGNTPLHEAVLGNNMEVCNVLIRYMANVYAKNARGYNILHLAASQGFTEMTEFILRELELGINECTEDGYTALHCASRNGRKECYYLLLELGADCSVKDKCNRLASSYISVSST